MNNDTSKSYLNKNSSSRLPQGQFSIALGDNLGLEFLFKPSSYMDAYNLVNNVQGALEVRFLSYFSAAYVPLSL